MVFRSYAFSCLAACLIALGCAQKQSPSPGVDKPKPTNEVGTQPDVTTGRSPGELLKIYFDPNNPNAADIFLAETKPPKEHPVLSLYERLDLPVQRDKQGIPVKIIHNVGDIASLACARGAVDIANCYAQLHSGQNCLLDKDRGSARCEFKGALAEVLSKPFRGPDKRFTFSLEDDIRKTRIEIQAEFEHFLLEFKTL